MNDSQVSGMQKRKPGKGLFFGIVLLFVAFWAWPVWAHKPSDAYLWLTVDPVGLHGRWDIALRDLDVVLALDANQDDKLTWGEVRVRQRDIDTYVLAHLSIVGRNPATQKANDATSPPCSLQAQPHAIDRHSDGAYLVVRFDTTCAVQAGFAVDYRLFDAIDPTHRGVTRVTFNGQPPAALLLDPAHGPVMVVPSGSQAASSAQTTPVSTRSLDAGPTVAHAGFLREGIHHILIGYDHILFLLCLLLPSVLVRRGTAMQGEWLPVSFRAAVWPLLGVVTAFTVAHSITLALAATGVVELPSGVIEPAIAVTIMLAALNNLWPVVTRRTAWITFAFGLIHGFGFASVLRDLGLPSGDFAWALLQFNLGVEIGQLLVVGVALVPLYLLRQQRLYPIAVMGTGSVLGITLAVIWFAERVFDFKVLPI